MPHSKPQSVAAQLPPLCLVCASILMGCSSSSPEPGNPNSGSAGNASERGGRATGGGALTGVGGRQGLGGDSSAALAVGGASNPAGSNTVPSSTAVGGTTIGTSTPASGVSLGGAKPSSGGKSGIGSTAAGKNGTGGKAASVAGSGGTSEGSAVAGRGAIGASPSGGTAVVGTNAAGGKANAGAGAGGAAVGGKSSSITSAGGAPVAGSSGASDLCPPGITQTLTVAKDGSGQFNTVQSAVDSITKGSSTHIRINIKAGTYKEKLTIENRSNLCLVGDDATTTILTYGDSNSSVGSTSGSASVLVSANDFSAAELTFQNSYGSGSQAVALRTTGQRQQFLNCRFVGYQDTLYVHSGSQYIRNCYVQGNTDFVFGGATAILQNCEVRNVEKGSAVAAPNTDKSAAYGIVFLGGQFTAASGITGVALARPWGADGAAAFLNAKLDSHISTAGFTSMSGNDPANARFGEYKSTGSGANASGRSSYQLTDAEATKYTVATVFGGAWTPSYSQ